ncbi:chemotaxis protein CheA [Marinococcus halophilus]|uniref:Chemotaxis protein CheA n=1 Tax=Marinococcus halophilus TaxID=1371 RepID=A0A510Y4D6_MARHA|nr:chemotaxis protein CheA [Marinococcus halophilus]OZT80034.1 chemotaxis protein CheA [Marinococcus halophilus]GEK58043.1 chemotaxis protein CheA [Marinococcus halophilus]
MSHTEYLDMFIEESQEHIQAINVHLLELEKQPEDETIIGEIFRSAHTMKGMAGTMGYDDLTNVTHALENVLDQMREKTRLADAETMDVLLEAADIAEEIVENIASGGDGKKDIQAITAKLLGKSTQSETALKTEKTKSVAMDWNEYDQAVIAQSVDSGMQAYTIQVVLEEHAMLKAARAYMVFEALEADGYVIKSVPEASDIEAERFDNEFTVAVVTAAAKEEVVSRIASISEIGEVLAEEIELGSKTENRESSEKPTVPVEKETSAPERKRADTNKTIRVNIDRLDKLMNLFEELVIDRGRLERISEEIRSSELTETVERMSRTTGSLQEIILHMRMVPVDQVFSRFPKMVRSLSRDLGKQIELEVIGAETELDRSIIDEIGDPLVHLIRNSIDHGIEMPEKRRQNGKPEEGHVELRAYHSGNHVYIEIEDDGGGIDRERVLKKAVENEVIAAEDADALTDYDIHQFIFSAGFSTVDKVTDLSGRGVGLDVVKNTFESLGGVISVHSEKGKGTKFSIQLPLTLSIIDVMLVDVGQEHYGLPLTSIVETASIKSDSIFYVHKRKMIDFRGNIIPVMFLEDVFEVPVAREWDRENYSVVVVHKGEKMAALVVDSFIGQQDVVLKSLGHYLRDVRAISGATILGDGNVALIVDTNALL